MSKTEIDNADQVVLIDALSTAIGIWTSQEAAHREAGRVRLAAIRAHAIEDARRIMRLLGSAKRVEVTS